jgi:hypothetical protein
MRDFSPSPPPKSKEEEILHSEIARVQEYLRLYPLTAFGSELIYPNELIHKPSFRELGIEHVLFYGLGSFWGVKSRDDIVPPTPGEPLEENVFLFLMKTAMDDDPKKQALARHESAINFVECMAARYFWTRRVEITIYLFDRDYTDEDIAYLEEKSIPPWDENVTFQFVVTKSGLEVDPPLGKTLFYSANPYVTIHRAFKHERPLAIIWGEVDENLS